MEPCNDELDFEVNSNEINDSKDKCYANQYALWLGKCEESKATVRNFHKLKEHTGFSTNKDMLQWLIRLGEITVKELGRKNKQSLLLYKNEVPNSPEIVVPYLGCVRKKKNLYVTRENEFTFIPFNIDMIHNTKNAPTLFVMKPNNSVTVTDKITMCRDVLNATEEMTVDEKIYQRYVHFLKAESVKAKTVYKMPVKKRRRTNNLDKTENNEHEPKLLPSKSEKPTPKSTTNNGSPDTNETKNLKKQSSNDAQQEIDSPCKKSVYIITTTNDGDKNISLEIHSNAMDNNDDENVNSETISTKTDDMEWVKIIKSTMPET